MRETTQIEINWSLVPNAARIAVLSTEATLKEVPDAARVLGLQIHVINASTSGEIDAAFAAVARERCDALFVEGDGFFNSRRVQFAILAARDRVPASYSVREYVEVGGLTSYGTNLTDMFRQVGTYTGNILHGAKPADLPVLQSSLIAKRSSRLPRERATPSHRHRVCLVRCCGSVSARYRTVAHNALVSCLGGEFSAFGLG
jgi:ABC-type uncharacterized transport system substrate-binding protein